MWRVIRQTSRWQGRWKTIFLGSDESHARMIYRDVAALRRRGNVCLLRGDNLVCWATRPK